MSYSHTNLKELNRRVVYDFLSEKGQTSKAEIAKATGLSQPTVLRIVEFLVQKGLVLELGEGESALGRKPQMLALNCNCTYQAAFFLEGDFLSMAVIDLCGAVRYKKTLRVEPVFDTIMQKILSGLVEGMFAECGLPIEKLSGINIALPAVYDSENCRILMAPLIGIREPLDVSSNLCDISNKYNVVVKVENDVNAQCLGEYCRGGAQDGDLVFISIGTGVGAGVILNGTLRRGKNHMCGEIGYMSFSESVLADSSSAGWLESAIGVRTLEKKFGVSFDNRLSDCTADKIKEISSYIAPILALCISDINTVLDCGAVVIGGIVGECLGNTLIDEVNQRLRNVSVRQPGNEDSGLCGIACAEISQTIDSILAEE